MIQEMLQDGLRPSHLVMSQQNQTQGGQQDNYQRLRQQQPIQLLEYQMVLAPD